MTNNKFVLFIISKIRPKSSCKNNTIIISNLITQNIPFLHFQHNISTVKK